MDHEEVSIREIHFDELPKLLDLYKHLHGEDPELDLQEVEPLWERIYNDPNLYYLAVVKNGLLVASCCIAIIPNLTRNARSYGLIENVVTHSDFRRKGYGTQVLQKALEIAWKRKCYKVMLLTGSKEEGTLLFYEKAGFKKGVKTGFIATSN